MLARCIDVLHRLFVLEGMASEFVPIENNVSPAFAWYLEAKEVA